MNSSIGSINTIRSIVKTVWNMMQLVEEVDYQPMLTLISYLMSNWRLLIKRIQRNTIVNRNSILIHRSSTTLTNRVIDWVSSRLVIINYHYWIQTIMQVVLVSTTVLGIMRRTSCNSRWTRWMWEWKTIHCI